MLYLIKRDVYRAIRIFGRLKPKEASDAMGKERQIVSRLERGDQMPTPEQESRLVATANLSRSAFVEIMCRVLTDFLGDGRRVTILPRGQHLPIAPIMRAGALYDLHHEKLTLQQQKTIEALLNQGRRIDVFADQTCDMFEDQIRRIIKEALAARGERLLDEDEAAENPGR